MIEDDVIIQGNILQTHLNATTVNKILPLQTKITSTALRSMLAVEGLIVSAELHPLTDRSKIFQSVLSIMQLLCLPLKSSEISVV